MCYSAKIAADYKAYVRKYGAKVDYEAFRKMLGFRLADTRIIIPKGVLDAFKSSDMDTADAQACRDLVIQIAKADATRWEQQLFEQKTRFNEAEKKLAVKETKSALESRRISGDKIQQAQRKLEDLQRTEAKEIDQRIYPGSFCPVLIHDEAGQSWVRPMRYLLRPPGFPASFDRQYPGCYNARRDSLSGFWKNTFGKHHAIVVAEAFFEHVDLHRLEGRKLGEGEEAQDVVLRFAPNDGRLMEAACLWAHWEGKEGTLDSFAAITDEPPPEVSIAGHDRCIVPLTHTVIADWLNAPAQSPAYYDGLLDQRERPYYAHLMAA